MRKLLPLFLILTVLQTQAQAQCDASFSVAVSGPTAHFISDTTRPGLLHRWKFGDGAQGFGPAVSHTYNASGVYQVLHTISDSLGLCNDSVIRIVNISFQTSCQASFVYQKDSIFPNKYHFFSTSTASGGSINSHNWTINGNFVSSAQGFSQTLPQGRHLVCLTITTTSGCSSNVCDSVLVDSSANCDLNADFVATVRRDTVFLQSVDSGFNLIHTWKFGDGQQGFGQNVMHRYNAPGTYVITHYVTDSATNCIDSAKRTVTITAPVTCQASFRVQKDSLVANRYNFQSTSTSSGGSIAAYKWTINGQLVSTASGFSRILPPGKYGVCLNISTTAGCTSTKCDSIQVGNPQPRCQASFVVVRDSLNHKKYRFFSTSTAQPGTIEAYRWTLNGQFVSKDQAFFAFLNNGVHRVCLTIKTSAGCVSTKCDSVVVRHDSIPVKDTVHYVASFPNPVAGSEVNLQLKLDNGAKVKLTVYNSRGNIVHKQESFYSAGYNRIVIPVDGLQRGQYFIDIQYNNTRKRSVFQKL
jgi:PKD repeat protein